MKSLDCDQALLLVAARSEREHELDEESKRALEEHLDGCDSCQESALGEERTLTATPGAGNDAAEAALPVTDPAFYRWRESIGRGGMGQVYRVHDRRLGRDVALKELLNPALAERFEREARLTARLQHPSIVTIHEAGRWPSGAPFYAMSLIEGRSLVSAIREATSHRDRLALLPHVIDAVEAMAYAHSRRIIHRDIKPHNIMIGSFGQTVILDWGLAKDLSQAEGPQTSAPYRESGELTRSGAGTPQYMAPEQAAGQEVDERADVYALGATLYHVLAGEPPYGDRSGRAIMAEIGTLSPTSLDEVAPDLPGDLRAIVAKSMHREPAQRYSSAEELAKDLRRFHAGRLVAAASYGLTERARRWVARHRAGVAIGAIAVALASVAGVTGYRAFSESRRAEREEARADRYVEAGLQLSAGLVDTNESMRAINLTTYMSLSNISIAIAEPDPRGELIAVLDPPGDRRIVSVGFSPDDSLIATADYDRETQSGELHVWRTSDVSLVASTPIEGYVGCLSFAPGGDRLYVGAIDDRSRTGHVYVLDPNTLEAMADAPIFPAAFCAAVSSERDLGLQYDRVTRSFALIEIQSRETVVSGPTDDYPRFFVDGQLLATVTGDKWTIRDTATGSTWMTIEEPGCTPSDIRRANGDILLACGEDEELFHRRGASGELAALRGPAGMELAGAGFGDDGSIVGLFGNNRHFEYVLFDGESLQRRASVEAPRQPVRSLAVDSTGERIVTTPPGTESFMHESLELRRVPVPLTQPHNIGARLAELGLTVQPR